MGPLAYFRVIRLHAVRDALMRGSEANASVAQIAHRWSFHRLAPLPTSIAGSSANFHPTRSVYAARHRLLWRATDETVMAHPVRRWSFLQQFTAFYRSRGTLLLLLHLGLASRCVSMSKSERERSIGNDWFMKTYTALIRLTLIPSTHPWSSTPAESLRIRWSGTFQIV